MTALTENRLAGICILWALLIASLASLAAAAVNNIHYQRFPMLGDTASYWLMDTRFAQKANKAEGSYLERHLAVIQQTPKDPLRRIAFAFMPPSTPFQLNGHLKYSAPSVFLFVLTLSWLVLQRTNSLPYALASPLVLFLAAGFFEPMYGLPSKLPDMPAALLMGSALFTLLSGAGRPSEMKWVFLSGLLLGLATLARYHVWIYGLFTMGPIAFLLGCRKAKETGRKLFVVIYPLLLLAGLALVAGWFIADKTLDMYRFYMAASYALNTTVWRAMSTTGRYFLERVWGVTGLVAMGFLVIGFIAMYFRGRARLSRFDMALIGWAAFSYPLLVLGIMKVEDIIEQSYYAIPGILLLAIVPLGGRLEGERESVFRTYSILLLLLLPLAAMFHYYRTVSSEAFIYPRPDMAAEKKFQDDLSDYVAASARQLHGRNPMTDSNFQYYTRYLEPNVRLKFNLQIEHANIFQIRESQWRLPEAVAGLDGPAIGRRTYALLAKNVDLYFALTKPLEKEWQKAFVDDYTRERAEQINGEIAKHPATWLLIGTVDGPYGIVSVYKNKSRFVP